MVTCAQPPAPHPISGKAGQQAAAAAAGSGHAGTQALRPGKMQADVSEGLTRLQAYIKDCVALRRKFAMSVCKHMTCSMRRESAQHTRSLRVACVRCRWRTERRLVSHRRCAEWVYMLLRCATFQGSSCVLAGVSWAADCKCAGLRACSNCLQGFISAHCGKAKVYRSRPCVACAVGLLTADERHQASQAGGKRKAPGVVCMASTLCALPCTVMT